MRFIEWKLLYFDIKLIEIYSQGSSEQYTSIGLDNGLTPNRQHAIIWANDGLLIVINCVSRPQWVKIN